jgi:hypothetical protein
MTKGVQRSERGYNTQVDEIVGGAVPAQSMTDVIEVRIEHTGIDGGTLLGAVCQVWI